MKSNPLKAGTIYIIANFFVKGISFVLLPIFTKIMSTNDYGIVSTYLSCVNVTCILVGLAMMSSIRAAYTDFKTDIYSYISTILWISMVACAIITGLFFLLFKERVNISGLLIVFCMIQSLGAFMTNCLTNLFMMQEKVWQRAMLMILPNLLIPVAGILLIKYTDLPGYIGRILPMVLVNVGLVVLCILYVYMHSKMTFNLSYAKYAFKVCFPLFFQAIAADILSTFDCIMITYFREASETAIYNVAYSISMIVLSVTGAINAVWIPWFTKKMKENNTREICECIPQYIDVALVATVGVIMVAPEFIKWFLNPSYYFGVYYIVPITVAAFVIFLYSIASDVEYYYCMYKYQAINTMVAALLNLILNYLFIPHYGALAAAYTTLVAYMTSMMIHTYFAKRANSDLIRLRHYLPSIVTLLITVIIYYLALGNMIVRWAFCLGFVAVLIIKHREIIEGFIGKNKSKTI